MSEGSSKTEQNNPNLQDSSSGELQKPDKQPGILSNKFSRRKALLLGVGTFVAGALAFEIYDENKESFKAFAKEIEKHPNTRFYFHNAADNPNTFNQAIRGPVQNIEIDVVHDKGKLYVSHSLGDFRALEDFQREEQSFEKIVRTVIDAGKNPAFDLKIDGNDTKGYDLFRKQVDELVPDDRLATFSGGTFEFLDQIPSSSTRLIAYTLSSNNVDQYFKRTDNWIKEGLVGRGATVELGSSIMDEVIKFNSSPGIDFPTNVWTVNNPDQVAALLKLGANGITTDSQAIIRAASIDRKTRP